jgi:hypothetical protein
MKTPASGQSSHKPGRRVDLPGRWLSVPTDVLWHFAVDLVSRHSLRKVAKMTQLGVETVRKFAMRQVEPNLSTRRRFAELFLRLHPEAAVERDRMTGEWKARPRMMTLLPEGMFEAREALVKLFALAKQHADELPLKLDDLHDWMDLQVCAEYNAENHFAAIGRGERPHDSDSIFARKPGKKRKKRGEGANEEAGT